MFLEVLPEQESSPEALQNNMQHFCVMAETYCPVFAFIFAPEW